MRRADREITDYNDILEVMKKCDVCRVAFVDGKYPYIIPMNFGVTMQDGKFRLYFHCATAGTKSELLRKNANVAFEMDCSHNLIHGIKACEFTMEYESVCGNGVIRILREEEKIAALTVLMNQYQPAGKHEFSYNEVKAVEVLELSVDEIHGKRLKKQTEASLNPEELGTLRCAKRYAAEGRIEAWVQKFLWGTGKNLALASGLLNEKRYYLGPVKMDMSLFDLPDGAPDYLTASNDIDWFFYETDKMAEAIGGGWDMPPLIVSYADGKYLPTDGRHRYAALRKMGAKDAYAIIWANTESDYNDLLSEARISEI